jgi:hypothetical protein
MRLLDCPPDGGLGLTSANNNFTIPYAILSRILIECQKVIYNELLDETRMRIKKNEYNKIHFVKIP